MTVLLLALIDRLIQFSKQRSDDRQQLFRELVEPLFVQLQPVLDDYFSMFRRAHVLVAKSHGCSAITAAAEEIRQNREAMIHARLKVRTLAKEIADNISDDRVGEFSRKVESLFYSSILPMQSKSDPMHLADLCEYVTSGRMEKSELLMHIETTLRQMEDRWVALAQSYAALRVYCMTPSRYKVEV